MNYERPIVGNLRAQLSGPTSVLHVLIGPRQVGKTTLAHYLRLVESAFLAGGLELFSRGV